jgi:hypothetical protein
MRCRVNGLDVEPDMLGRRPMNFRQAFPGAEPPVIYEIKVPTADFIVSLRDVYDRSVREEIADGPFHQLGEWPLLDRLQVLDYPPLEEMVAKYPDLLADLVREWLDMETLDLFIPGCPPKLPDFIVNSVDSVTIDHNFVRIQGKAYRHPMLVHQA